MTSPWLFYVLLLFAAPAACVSALALAAFCLDTTGPLHLLFVIFASLLLYLLRDGKRVGLWRFVSVILFGFFPGVGATYFLAPFHHYLHDFGADLRVLTFGEQFEYAGYWYESTPLAEIITVPGIALLLITCRAYSGPIAGVVRWSVVVTGPPRADQVKKPSPVAGSRPVKRAAEPNGTMRSPGNRKKRRVAEPQAALVATATPVVITLTPQHAALAAHEDEALARSEEASGLEDGSDAPVSPAAIPTVAALVEKAPAPTDDDLPIPRTAGPVEVSPATATAPLPAAVVETSLVSADHGLPVTYRGRR